MSTVIDRHGCDISTDFLFITPFAETDTNLCSCTITTTCQQNNPKINHKYLQYPGIAWVPGYQVLKRVPVKSTTINR